MSGIGETDDVPSVFDHEMLESATSAEKRDAMLSCIANPGEGVFKTPVGTARSADKTFEMFVRLGFVGREPHGFNRLSKHVGRVLNALIGCTMDCIVRIKVTDDANSDRFHAIRMYLTLACVKTNDFILNMINFDPSISALRLVQKIVQTGKLTAAAEQLNISQSGASHSLRILESQLGSAIFVREREGLRLSEAGQRLLPYIEAMLGNLGAVHAELASLSGLKTGSLRVAAVPSLLGSILPPVLREYSTNFPGIDLSIFEGTDDEVSSWVLTGVAHVGFAALPVASVTTEEIARDEWLALMPQHRALKKSSITLQELLRYRFLMSGGGCETHIQRLFSIQGLNIPDHMMVKQLSTIQAMVAQDLGVSLVPSLSIKDVQGIAAIPLKPRQFRSIGMLYASASVSSPALQTWMNLARDRLRRQASPLGNSRRVRLPKQQRMDRLRSAPRASHATTLRRGGKHSEPPH